MYGKRRTCRVTIRVNRKRVDGEIPIKYSANPYLTHSTMPLQNRNGEQ